MGSMTAMGLAENARNGLGSLRLNVACHLQSNHYPSLPLSLVPVALRAIRYANKEQWHKRVRMPKNLSFRGMRLAPVGDLIESLHLEFFLNPEIQ